MSSSLPLVLEPEQWTNLAADPAPAVVDLCKSENYPARHLPGAAHLPYDRLVSKQPPAGGLLPAADDFSAMMRELGIHAGQHVVAYDEEGGGRAARLVWTLHAYGHRAASVLNGGIEGWLAAGLAVSDAPSQPSRPGDFVSVPDPSVVADYDYVLARLHSPLHILLDARSPAEYTGERKLAERGGHIPGARHLDWTELMDHDRQRRLRPAAELRALLAARAIGEEQEVIVYCQTHHRSALSYLALTALGYPRVRGYHGSWSQWGNRPDAPVETGQPAP